MQPIKITRTIENISNRKLSIQFSLDGFSFCISNFENTPYHFSSYSFGSEVQSPETLLVEIQNIFQNDKELQDDFESVTVIHENNLNSLVPNQFFQEEALKSYLDFNIKTISTDYIAFDDINELQIKNVYVPYVNINNFLFQNFGEFEYKHHSTQLIENLFSIQSESSPNAFVNVASSRFDMIVFENSKLIFSNSFEFNTKEDFIYYILFTYEQLQLDTNEVALHFTGEINEDSELYKTAYTYIKDLDFVKSPSTFMKETNSPSHANYILLG